MILYCWSVLPFTYILSFLFKAPDRAQTVFGLVWFICFWDCFYRLLRAYWIAFRVQRMPTRYANIFTEYSQCFACLMALAILDRKNHFFLANHRGIEISVCGHNMEK